MNTYKAVISNFDGTLVNHDLKVSAAVSEMIQKYREKGGIFSLATGRGYPGNVERVCHELGLEHPVIVRGGSEIINPKTKEVIWAKYIVEETVEKLKLHLRSLKFFFAAERGQFVYSVDGVSDKELGPDAEFLDIGEMPLDYVPKFVIPPLYQMEEILPVLEELTNSFPYLHIVKTTSRKGVGIDINDGGAGKHMALLAYSALMQLRLSEIIGVGDSYNDYPLLSACGYKFAMGNAPEELKEIADKIVGTQEDDGVLKVLEFASNLFID